MDLPDEQQKIWGRMLPAYADEYKHRFSPDGMLVVQLEAEVGAYDKKD